MRCQAPSYSPTLTWRKEDTLQRAQDPGIFPSLPPFYTKTVEIEIKIKEVLQKISNVFFSYFYYTKLYECCCCEAVFSETKNTFLEGLRKPISLIVMVVKARAEGMTFNAACRTFEISKNTLILWQSRLANIKKTLFLFSLAHEFLKMVIEGDELYTKVKKNVPPEDSRGWTIVLMERASRFIWFMECGRKDKKQKRH